MKLINPLKRLEFKIFDPTVPSSARLDVFLLAEFQQTAPELSRVRLQSLIREGFLTHNGNVITSNSKKIHPGIYILTIPDVETSHILPSNIPVPIVFEDEDIIVINKPAGLSVHPGAGNTTHTLVNALLHSHEGKLSGIGGIERPGIVHRLDKDTSGLMVVAKHDAAHHKLSAQFAKRSLSRTYLALVFGKILKKCDIIDAPIARHPRDRQRMAVVKSGKAAVTHYKVLSSFKAGKTEQQSVSLVECTLETGRTHQIRVHMQHIGHPLVGDPVYGKGNIPHTWDEQVRAFPRQALHAKNLRFIHPRSGEIVSFEAELPDDIQQLLQYLNKDLH